VEADGKIGEGGCVIGGPAGLRWWLSPLRLLRAPVEQISLTLLLSLRFMALVFEEVSCTEAAAVAMPCRGRHAAQRPAAATSNRALSRSPT
jgi:hypothetical protein